MKSGILLAFLLSFSCVLGVGQVAHCETPAGGTLSKHDLVGVGGRNASGYQILNELDGWDAATYADAVLISIRGKWYPRISSCLCQTYGKQRAAIIDVHIKGNGTVRHMGRHASAGNSLQDDAAWEAIREAGPFQPFPAELQKKTLKLRFHFNYNLPQAEQRPACGLVPPGVFRVSSEVKAPRVQDSPDPEFSDSARRDKYQGEVEIGLTVAEDGLVRDVCVAQSLGEGLDEKSVAAVKNWKFEPATRHGEPVPVRISVTTDFHLY